MLTGPKQKILEELVLSSSKDELLWINGYIAGLLAGTEKKVALNSVPEPAAAISIAAPGKITVVYGTETGNSKKLATELAAKAKKKNITVKLSSLDQYRLTDLTKEEKLLVVISTQGDGEPPVAAQKFYDHIHRNGFKLDQLKYSVLALGDTSYPMFCKTGEDVDEQLQKLGGKRILDVKKCDLDYEADAEKWFDEVLQAVTTAPSIAISKTIVPSAVPVTKSNKKIYTGTIASHINLHDRGSEKTTWHIELLVDEAVDYLPGDSIGIVPFNDEHTVRAIIALTGVDEKKLLKHKESEYTIYDLLLKKLNINYLHERVVKKYAEITKQQIPETKMDVLDILKIYPVKDAAQFEEIVLALPAQSPRIYTIASSNTAHDGELHLTVEKDVFATDGREKTGVCSDYLGNLIENDTVEFFVQKNKRFKLPAADKDIIMIGPGTGIAAFRSFLSERDATGAAGKNWLFFGEDHFVSDFFYQTEIQNWFETGVLTKLSLAFSKDRPGNIFVHHKMLEYGKEIFEWMQSGAHIYVCGQKAPMSVEVENALLSIIERYSGLPAKETAEYFETMKSDGRYSKDVY